MDQNQYNGNNDFFGAPQPPFNERGQEPQSASPVNPAGGFEPQHPFAQPPQPAPQGQPVYPPRPAYPQQQGFPPQSEGFNPIQHTAAYQDGAFERPAYPQPPVPPQAQPPVQEPADFSQSEYYASNADLRAAYESYNASLPPREEPQPAQPVNPQPVNPPQPDYAQPTYTQKNAAYAQPVQPPQPYAQPLPAQQLPASGAPKKAKGNKGLIIVIIVLSVLLAGSLGGILVYSLNHTPESSSFGEREKADGNDDHSLFDDLPEFTFPNRDNDKEPATKQPETTEPAHGESDYSNQTDKNYKGLELEKKPADAATGNYSAEYAFDKAAKSVVGVLCYSDSDEKSLASQGSGIIITSDGYVVTNAHVIGNSKNAYSLRVMAEDGVKYTAGVVGFDSRTDIALLKLKDAKNLSAAAFGDSDDLKLGEDIIVIGNPGGLSYQNSMTKGIVSAIDREASSKSIVKYIQTDAAINPGNSGGPAVNLYGQVIGIASAKIVSEQYEGMGFCIPSATAKEIIDDLMKNGYIEGRVKIGISGYAVEAEEIQTYGLPQGILIQEITAGGPCDGTDLQPDDVITEADGTAITSFADMYKVLENHKPGDKIKLKYYRYSTDKEGEVTVTLQEDK